MLQNYDGFYFFADLYFSCFVTDAWSSNFLDFLSHWSFPEFAHNFMLLLWMSLTTICTVLFCPHCFKHFSRTVFLLLPWAYLEMKKQLYKYRLKLPLIFLVTMVINNVYNVLMLEEKISRNKIKKIWSLNVTCSNEMSRMSANLISRKHHINMYRWFSTILTFCHQSILSYLFCQLAMLISRLYYYLVHTLCNISRMNFVKENR